jgi:hypothetical protein
MANKKTLMFDADTYTPADSQFFRWDSSTESVIPTEPPNLAGYTGQSIGTGTAPAGAFVGGTNKTYAVSGHVAVTVLTPGTGSSYTAGDTAVWHLQGVIIKHTTGGSFTVYPTVYSTGQGPTYDFSAGNNLFSAATISLSAASGTVYLTYTPEVSASATVANTIVNISSQLIVTENAFV